MVEELEDQLSIKLKNVPREEEEEEEEGYGVFYGESEKKKKITRICHVCNKGFSSGKALGGHMRIHGQLYKKRKEDAAFQLEEEEEEDEYEYCYDDNEEEDDERVKKKRFMKKMKMVVPVCLICGKDFQSMKSLYGHMRSHPRDWKGIHPPAAAENPVVDLKKALKCRWSVTAKRGRKVMSGGDQTSSLSEDTEEEQLRDAAHELMMLAHGGESRRHDQELDSKSLSYEVMTKNVRGKAKAAIPPENQESKKKSISGYRETRADEKTRKKRMKLIKLKDLESVHHNATATIDHDNRTPAAAEKYKCSECDKWFRTHQALGGHKSSHNKLCKMVIQNSIDDDPLMPSNQVTNSSGELSHTAAAAACGGGISHHNHQILDFDLNEVPETTE